MPRKWWCKQFYHEQKHKMRDSTARRWKIGKRGEVTATEKGWV